MYDQDDLIEICFEIIDIIVLRWFKRAIIISNIIVCLFIIEYGLLFIPGNWIPAIIIFSFCTFYYYNEHFAMKRLLQFFSLKSCTDTRPIHEAKINNRIYTFGTDAYIYFVFALDSNYFDIKRTKNKFLFKMIYTIGILQW